MGDIARRVLRPAWLRDRRMKDAAEPTGDGPTGPFRMYLDAEGTIATAWRLGGIASYSNEQNAYWGRARVTRIHDPTRAFGLEALANGNDEADATAAGLFFTFRPAAAKFSLGLKAGYRFQDDADGAYGGVEIGFGF